MFTSPILIHETSVWNWNPLPAIPTPILTGRYTENANATREMINAAQRRTRSLRGISISSTAPMAGMKVTRVRMELLICSPPTRSCRRSRQRRQSRPGCIRSYVAGLHSSQLIADSLGSGAGAIHQAVDDALIDSTPEDNGGKCQEWFDQEQA